MTTLVRPSRLGGDGCSPPRAGRNEKSRHCIERRHEYRYASLSSSSPVFPVFASGESPPRSSRYRAASAAGAAAVKGFEAQWNETPGQAVLRRRR